LGITQRSVSVKYDGSKEKYSLRKLIPVNPKTLGDHLLLKRIEADLTQPEVAQKAGVSVRTVHFITHVFSWNVGGWKMPWSKFTGRSRAGKRPVFLRTQIHCRLAGRAGPT